MSLLDELASGMTGLEALRTLVAAGGRPPIGEALDFAMTDAGDGWAVFESTPTSGHYNPMGTVHGGYAATLLDSACGCAALSKLSANQGFTTLELKVSYLRAITADTGPLVAKGKVTSIGRRAAFTEAELHDKAGRLLATATSTLLIIERPSGNS